jgi:hypothetical protein
MAQMRYACLAFLDVLGFSRMVTNDARAAAPVHLDFFRTTLAKIAEAACGGLDARMFSDSIVVAAELSIENVVSVMEAVAGLQLALLTAPILVRGGIALGRHYSDDRVIYSEALVVAYRLESQEARVPRVLVDENLWDWAVNFQGVSGATEERLQRLTAIDRDGRRFVDYLRGIDLGALAPRVEACCEQGDRSDSAVIEKLRWLADYYNYCARMAGCQELVVEGVPDSFTREH